MYAPVSRTVSLLSPLPTCSSKAESVHFLIFQAKEDRATELRVGRGKSESTPALK